MCQLVIPGNVKPEIAVDGRCLLFTAIFCMEMDVVGKSSIMVFIESDKKYAVS